MSELDLKTIFAGLRNGTLKTFNTSDYIAQGPSCVPLTEGGSFNICALPDGRIATSFYSSNYQVINLWDLTTNNCIKMRTESEGRVAGRLIVLPDNKEILVSHCSITISLWDLANGILIKKIKVANLLENQREEILSMCALFNNKLAVLVNDWNKYEIQLWDIHLGVLLKKKVIQNLNRNGFVLKELNGDQIVCVFKEQLFIYDFSNEENNYFTDEVSNCRSICTSIAILQDGNIITSHFESGLPKVNSYSPPTGKLLLWQKIENGFQRKEILSKEIIYSLASIRDGRIAARYSNCIKLLDPISGKVINTLYTDSNQADHPNTIKSLMCGLSDGRLAAHLEDGNIRVWTINDLLSTCKDIIPILESITFDYPNVIEKLSLDNFSLEQKSFSLLSQLVKSNKQLQTISLKNTSFSSESIRTFCSENEFIESGNSLEFSRLSLQPISTPIIIPIITPINSSSNLTPINGVTITLKGSSTAAGAISLSSLMDGNGQSYFRVTFNYLKIKAVKGKEIQILLKEYMDSAAYLPPLSADNLTANCYVKYLDFFEEDSAEQVIQEISDHLSGHLSTISI